METKGENSKKKRLTRKSDLNLIARLNSPVRKDMKGAVITFAPQTYKELPAYRFYSDADRLQNGKKTHVLSLRDLEITCKGNAGKVLTHKFRTQTEADKFWEELTGLKVSINNKVLSEEDTKTQMLMMIPEDQRVTSQRYKSPHDASMRLRSLLNGTRSKDGEMKILDDTKNITPDHMGFVKSQALRTIYKNGEMIQVTHKLQLIGSTIKVIPVSQVEDYDDFSVVYFSEHKAAEFWGNHVGATLNRNSAEEVVVELDKNKYPTIKEGQLLKLNTRSILLVIKVGDSLKGISVSNNPGDSERYVLDIEKLTKKLDLTLKSSYISVVEIREVSDPRFITEEGFEKCNKVWTRKHEVIVFNGLQYLKEDFMSAVTCLNPMDEEFLKELRKDDELQSE